MRIASIVPAVFGAALIFSAAQTASAQGGPLPYGAPINLAQATKVMEGAMAEAKKNNWNVVISIVDSGGHLVMLHRMDNVQLGSVDIATGKATTALKMRRPTKVMQDGLAAGGEGLRMLTFYPGIVLVDGGVLVVEGGKIIGAVGVSGVTSAQDGQIAKAGADTLGK
jgi:glc operon protein GlcG